jgi:hypothetical protein
LKFTRNTAFLSITTQSDPRVKQFRVGLLDLYLPTPQKAFTQLAVPEPPQRWNENPLEFAFILGTPLKGNIWMKGKWTGEDTFQLTVRDSRDFDRDTLTFHFSGQNVSIDWYSLNRQATILTLQGKLNK